MIKCLEIHQPAFEDCEYTKIYHNTGIITIACNNKCRLVMIAPLQGIPPNDTHNISYKHDDEYKKLERYQIKHVMVKC